MNLAFWKSNRPRPVLQVVHRNSMKLRLHEWRNDPKLVSEASKVLVLEVVQWMLDVLRNESPSNAVLPLNVAPESRAAQQCRSEGYLQALANLEAMGTMSQSPEAVEATFEPEETPSQ